jgi:GNAT superfamily N-acetyltransferase
MLAESGWAERVADTERFRLMMERATRAVVAVERTALGEEGPAGERVIGFARALTDDVCNGYISMLVVAPDRRGGGVGRALVERLTGDDPRITWVLRAGHGSAQFWRRLGFESTTIAMARVRTTGG